jgi:hypothetical protein
MILVENVRYFIEKWSFLLFYDIDNVKEKILQETD